jgi:hypothetical protein
MMAIRTSRPAGHAGLFVCVACWAALPLACSSGNKAASPDDQPPVPDASSYDATTPIESGPAEASAMPNDAGSSDADAAEAGDAGDCAYGSAGEPLDLRCTGLYADWSSKTVSAGVHEYDPGLHLWSDGAVKTRWVYLPPKPSGPGRAPIDTSNMDEWKFPVGTKLWKEFVLGGKRVETRMLWKQSDSNWYMTTYQWSPDESDATEFTDGELDADGNGYEIPAQYMCMQCHGGRQDMVLGFEAMSLASAGAKPITMATLADAGWITDPPDASLAIPGNAAAVAALGYLHANCGIACHNRGGGGAFGTGFYMRLETAKLGSVQATDTWTTGVNQLGRFTAPVENARLLRLAPYDAGQSCVHYRMSLRTGVDDAGPGLQMPQIDSHKVDEAGVATITQWIDNGCQ